MRWFGLFALSALLPVARAQDVDGNGCVDAWEPACVGETAQVDASASLAGSAQVFDDAFVGPGVSLGEGVEVHSKARIVGHSNGAAVGHTVGDSSVISVYAELGLDASVGSSVILGRYATLGERTVVADDVSAFRRTRAGNDSVIEASAVLGYGSEFGDRLFLGERAMVGNLVVGGDDITIATGAVLARGVSLGSNIEVAGIVGPDTMLLGNNVVGAGARIRKDVIIGQGTHVEGGARVGRRVVLGTGVLVQAGAYIPTAAEIGEGCVVGPDDYIVRGQIVECLPDVQGAAAIDAGTNHTCAVSATDGSVSCWGANNHGQSTPVAGVFESVSAGVAGSCATTADGTPSCWGTSHVSSGIQPGPFVSTITGGYGACGLVADGSVSCWGSTSSFSTVLSQADAGQHNTCGVRQSDSSAFCHGSNYAGLISQVPHSSFLFDSISVGTVSACGIRSETKVPYCWGNPVGAGNSEPNGSYTQLAVGYDHACGLTDTGSIDCWGGDADGLLSDAPDSGTWTHITSGDYHTCAVRDDAVVYCWGRNDLGQVTTPFDTDSDGLSDSDELRVGTDMLHPDTDGDGLSDGDEVNVYGSNPFVGDTDSDGIGDNEEVLGTHPNAFGPSHPAAVDSDADGVSDPDEALAQPATDPLFADAPNAFADGLSASSLHACAVDPLTGELTCWGSNQQGEATAPSGLFWSVAVANNSSCGVRQDGTVQCWGATGDGLPANVPSGKHIQVAVGREGLACALGMGRRVSCWGDTSQLSAGSPTERYRQIDVGWRVLCGVQQSDDTPRCFGNNFYNQVTPAPTGVTALRTVDFSGGSTCGLRADTGEFSCWGTGDAVASGAPGGSFDDVDLGNSDACAVDASGVVHCWGWSNSVVVSDAPTSAEWTDVTVGEGFACARRTDNLVYCWGQDTLGQASPPMDEDGDGLVDSDEIHQGTDPYVSDTDGDGLSDGDEVHVHGTDPLGVDSDGDGLSDGDEVLGSYPGAFGPSAPLRVDSDLDGMTDLEEATSMPATNPLVPDAPGPATARVSIGVDHACATDLATGELHCWGEDRFGQASPPSGSFWGSSSQRRTGCGLRTDGTVACWGWYPYDVVGFEPTGVFAFTARYGDGVCAFDGAGQATCWGDVPISNPVFPPMKMATGASVHICGLTMADSTPYCLGYGNYGVPSDAPSDVAMRDIGVGDRVACGLRESDGGLVCWGEDTHIENSVPSGAFDHVAVGSQNACVIDTAGALTCWGYSAFGAVSDHPTTGVWTDVVAGPSSYCATRQDDLIACWGDTSLSTTPFDQDGDGLSDSDEVANDTDPFVTDTDGDGVSDADEVLVHGSNPLVVDTDGDGIDDQDELAGTFPGAVSASDPVAADSDGDNVNDALEASAGTHPLVPNQAYVHEEQLSVGSSSACHVDPVTAELTCWGANGSGQANPPAGAFYGVAAGSTSCGRRVDGTVACWGANSDGSLSDTPSGLMSMVTVYGSTPCALTPRGDMTCWGRTRDLYDHERVGTVASIANYFSRDNGLACGLRAADSSAVCAGASYGGVVANTPSNTEAFRAVDTSYNGACAIRVSDSGLTCWGDGALASSAPTTGAYVDVSVGDSHACAVSDAGTLTCWGSDFDDSISGTPTTGVWTDVDAGYRYACATRDDGLVACWGRDEQGQSSPPMDEDGDGLVDSDEIALGTDAYQSDTDADGLPDYDEVNLYDTDPLLQDGDGDGLSDAQELDGSYPGAVGPSDPRVVDSDGDGTSDLQEAQDGTDPMVSDAPNPYVSGIAVGDYHSCAVDPVSGVLTCWGSNVYGESNSPTGAFWTVGTGYFTTCGLREDNSLSCSGHSAFGVPSSAPSGFFTAVDLGEYFGCALRPSGELSCWGSTSHFPIAGPFEPMRQIDSSYLSLCGLRMSDQTPICYGSSVYRHIADVPAATPMTDIGTGPFAACGVQAADGALACWGQRNPIENNVPTGAFVKVDVGIDHACAIDTSGTLTCWGDLPTGTYSEPPALGYWVDVSLGDNHACAERDDGAVACWGEDSFGMSTPPFDSDGDGLSDNDELHAGGDPFGLDGDADGLSDVEEITIYGTNPASADTDGDLIEDADELFGTYPSNPPPLGPSDPNAVDGDGDGIEDLDEIVAGTDPGLPDQAHPLAQTTAAGDATTCRVQPNGQMACVGANGSGQTSPPATLFWSVDMQGTAGCGITRLGTIECWGSNAYNLLTPPSGQFAKVTAGRGFGRACAMTPAGEVTCWGANIYFGFEPLDVLVDDIDLSHDGLCAIRRDDGLPVCVGNGGGGATGAAAITEPVSAIATGYRNSCVILEASGEVQCWGTSQYGVNNAPSGAHWDVGTGETHACALPLVGGGVNCWGNDNDGKVSGRPVSGDFVSLTVGVNHSCATRSDGVELCWGSNSNGESTVP